MLGRFVGTTQVEALLVQPAAHVGPVDEAEVEPVVAHAAGVGNAVVVAGFVAARLPVEADESATFPVAERLEEAGRKLEGCFDGHVCCPFCWLVNPVCGISRMAFALYAAPCSSCF